MEILRAVILGIVEGLTEFLPISSTGHLIVAEDVMNYHDTSKLFTVVIQTGAILAVVWFYRQQLKALVDGLLHGSQSIRRFTWLWFVATLPAGLFGLLLDEKFDRLATPGVVAVALIAGGIAIWLIETFHHSPNADKEADLRKLSTKQAIQVGLYQVLALIPGVSRSGATILGGMLAGLDRVTATAFSFYLGIPILLMAGVYKLATGDLASVEGGGPAVLVGLVASFVTAFVVIGWLLRYVSSHNFKPFAYYRIGFGLFLLILIGLNILG